MTLTEEQEEAITSTAKRKLIIAGPGSGKTTVMVEAIAHQRERESSPSSIVAITYTNAAAYELERRLKAIDCTIGFVGTLHAFCLQLITEKSSGTLSVIDDEQKEDIIETIMKEMGVKASKKGITCLVGDLDYWLPMLPKTELNNGLVAREYHRRLRASGLLDFNSILFAGLFELLKSDAPKFGAMLVDEVQDASDIDWRIYGAINADQKVFVGDPDQSIFGFRGGSVGNMVATADLWNNPKASGPGMGEVHTLENNYRSGEAICKAAQSLIEHNKMRYSKSTQSNIELGSVCVKHFQNTHSEEVFVINQIAIENGYIGLEACWSDFAVLARTNWLANQFAQALKANGVPVTQTKYADRPPDWKTAKLLLTVLSNPWNDLAVYQLMKLTSSLSFADNVKLQAAKAMKSINEYLGNKYGNGDASVTGYNLDLSRHGLSSASRERIRDACRELSRRGSWRINDLILYLNTREEEEIETGEGVTVSTMHGAKGREWDTVFIVGAEEGLTPNGRVDADLEEERRLFYVAMTRAKTNLFISWCASRPEYRGQFAPPGEAVPRERSRFIAEAGL